MTHENAEDLTANVLVGRSVRHRSTIGFARHRSYGCTATVDKIAQPMGNLASAACPLSGGKADIAVGGVLSLANRNGRPDVTRVTYKFFHFRYEWVLEARRGPKRESPHSRGRR